MVLSVERSQLSDSMRYALSMTVRIGLCFFGPFAP